VGGADPASVVTAGAIITGTFVTGIVVAGIALPTAMGGSTGRDWSSRELAAAREWLRTWRCGRFGAAVVEWSTRKSDGGLGRGFGPGDIAAAGRPGSAPGRACSAPR
jgi:hypothetical protein